MSVRPAYPLVLHSLPKRLEDLHRPTLAKALAQTGLEFVENKEWGSQANIPILLMIGGFNNDTFAAVQQLSCSGNRRLAVVLAPEFEADSDVGWQVMALGASEML